MHTLQKHGFASRRGFTLIELLVVIAIIMLLAGLLLPAVALARKRARVAAARAEVKNIETAWKQYYSEYERWPDFVTDESPFCMQEGVARTLVSGTSSDNNPRQLRFLESKRVNASGSPVVPWADISYNDTDTFNVDDPEDGAHFYWVKFDANYDNRIVGCGTCVPSILQPISNDVQRTVIVWTVNPDFEVGDPDYIIGSWQ